LPPVAKPLAACRRIAGSLAGLLRTEVAGVGRLYYMSAVMIDDIYNKQILTYAGSIPRIGRLPDADATATAHSRLCGSTVTVDI
jgi:hypothetical protein